MYLLFLLMATAFTGLPAGMMAGQQAPASSSPPASQTKQTSQSGPLVSRGFSKSRISGDDPVYDAALAQASRSEIEARALLRAGKLTEAEQVAIVGQALWLRDPQRLPHPMFQWLLGDVRLRQGRYADALQYYQLASKHSARSGEELNIALCFVRLGNDEMARQFYSDQTLLRYSSISLRELPGTNNHQALEASILLAHGLEGYLTHQEQEALEDLDAAGKLAPHNGLIAYYAAQCLLRLKRSQDAVPYLQRAAKYGHGQIAKESARYIDAYQQNAKTSASVQQP